MGFADLFSRFKPITSMIEHGANWNPGQAMHKIGPWLKGCGRKRQYNRVRHAYSPQFISNKHGSFAVFPDRAYQIVKGTWYRCMVRGTLITPRFSVKGE